MFCLHFHCFTKKLRLVLGLIPRGYVIFVHEIRHEPNLPGLIYFTLFLINKYPLNVK